MQAKATFFNKNFHFSYYITLYKSIKILGDEKGRYMRLYYIYDMYVYAQANKFECHK